MKLLKGTFFRGQGYHLPLNARRFDLGEVFRGATMLEAPMEGAAAITSDEQESESNHPDQIHSFSRTLAEKYGWKAALILQFLAVMIATSKNFIDGKRWYYITLDSLAERYPYIHRATIHKILKELTKPGGPLLKGNYNKHRYDRTGWYAFEDDFVRRSVSLKPVYFSVKDAKRLGVVEAVLLKNISHWVKKNREKDSSYSWHRMSGQGMTKHLPFSKSVINRALEHLVEAGELERQAVGGFHREHEYRILDETRFHEPNLDIDDPGLDMDDPNVDMQDPELDNNTNLKDTLNRHHLKRHSFQERQAKPSAGGVSALELTKKGSQNSESSNGKTPSHIPALPVNGKGSANTDTGSTTQVIEPPSEFEVLCHSNKSRSDQITPEQLAGNLCGLAYLTVQDVIRATDDKVLWQLVHISKKDELLKAVSTLLDNRQDKSWATRRGEDYRDHVENLAKEFFVAACVECGCRSSDILHESIAHAVEDLTKRLQPYFNAEEKERQKRLYDGLWKEQQERAKRHPSPDNDKEGEAAISPAEKVMVLRNSLIARNRAGWPSKDGTLISNIVDYNDRSLRAAYKFFQANPDVSVEHLNTILDCCVDNRFWGRVKDDYNDPSFWIRGGTHLSFFFGHLDKIITQLSYAEFLPPINFLTKEEMGLDRKPKEEAPKDLSEEKEKQNYETNHTK